MNEEKKLKKDLFDKLTESQKNLKNILYEAESTQSDTDRDNSLKEISDQIESAINQLKIISEEE
tara:strand:- start:81 stop:272 length:192 start_codon:yes stop_codon:yes gene_type:complete